ncbi:hypothetical protein VV02_21915 [Luteipulveratus mongoliensis]|uniref:Uncharacterized protein n=1 Tax=Luteipulveratus mongoliensis TaxID=571913 RepID=A0A0K1JMF3_9MICO|nr:hypothetical protein VV02_21915 [Luteipulveratus mongoliensis]
MGIGVAAYGAWLLLDHAARTKPLLFVVWLAGAVVVHDFVIAPTIEGVGRLIARVPLARGHIQAAAVAVGLIGSVGLVIACRAQSAHDPALTLLQQDYARNLAVLLGLVVLVSAASYAGGRLRGRITRRRG